jgi:hypothetical protein
MQVRLLEQLPSPAVAEWLNPQQQILFLTPQQLQRQQERMPLQLVLHLWQECQPL